MFSIVAPLDDDRFDLFAETKRAYDRMPQRKEIILPTRRITQVIDYLAEHRLDRDVSVIPYTYTSGFNPAMALNIGVRAARYETIIITCPEVRPQPDVLDKLSAKIGRNVVCQVWAHDEHGQRTMSLVNSSYRAETPGFYFLAMYNRTDIETINAWDEEFMRGHSHEDADFGARWVRAGLPFEIDDDIQADHLYHPPHGELVAGANDINEAIYRENTRLGITRCKHGLIDERGDR